MPDSTVVIINVSTGSASLKLKTAATCQGQRMLTGCVVGGRGEGVIGVCWKVAQISQALTLGLSASFQLFLCTLEVLSLFQATPQYD